MTDFQYHGDESSYEVSGRMRPLSTDDVLRESSLYSRGTRDELLLSSGDVDGLTDTDSESGGRRGYSRLSEQKKSSYDDVVSSDKGLLLKTLIDAESAANSAAIQLVSFKDILDEDFADSRCSSDLRLSRQRGLLLDKLEVFKRINKSVRQQLKQLQDQEACRIETDRQIDVLLKRLTRTESENQHLKSSLSEKERRVEELMSVRKKELEKMESVVQQSRSVESTRAHLQKQLCSKEAESNRLMVQLRGLERKLTEQKLEIDDLKGQISTASERVSQEKEALKRATRAQKQRAERFEAAVEKCYDQLREKDVALAEARAERDAWKAQQEEISEEKGCLDTEMAVLREQTAHVTAELMRERDSTRAANEALLKKVENLNSDNSELRLDNATLKGSIADLESKLEESATVFQEHSARSQERKGQLDEYQTQIAELQTEIADLKINLESLRKEKENILEGRDAEVAKAEQQQEKLKSSVEMKDSINEANIQLQEKVASLQKRLEEALAENGDLVHRLSAQDEALSYGSRQLEQRSAQCHALSRQLETALTDVRLQVSKVKEKTSAREAGLQARLEELEAEKSRRDNELKMLKQSKIASEKQYESRLRDLQLSLDQSESHKQSIQNYVDFLKNSYSTMFDEGLPSTFGSSYFLK